MNLRFVVEVELERTEGKFTTKDEMAEQIISELEGADPGYVEGDEGGQYEVASFEVSEEDAPRGKVSVWMTPRQAALWAEHGTTLTTPKQIAQIAKAK